MIARAERLTVMGVELPVPRTSDLILLKLAAGGYLDLHDAAALLALGDRDTLAREVEAHIGEVRPAYGTSGATDRAGLARAALGNHGAGRAGPTLLRSASSRLVRGIGTRVVPNSAQRSSRTARLSLACDAPARSSTR